MPEASLQDLRGLTAEEVRRILVTSPDGLSHEEARRRLSLYGPNHLEQIRPESPVRSFFKQFTHFLAVLLGIAAGLAFLADRLRPGEGMAMLGWAMLGVILLNAIFAFFQEYKAERAIQALRLLLPATTWVLRAGQPEEVPCTEVVPGDVLLLEEGERIPADARLVEAVDLRMDNASLTGESRAVRRTADPAGAGHLHDLPNVVLAGTAVLSGRGRAVVAATGMKTEFGQIAHLSTLAQPGATPLQREIARVTHVVGVLSLGMGLLFFAIGLSMGLGLWTSAIFGIGIIAANVPEGLLPTVTFALAMGAQRMAKRKALIKHLNSVETLGCATVICTDKTGTLTENRMKVQRLFVDRLQVQAQEGCLNVAGRVLTGLEVDRWKDLFDALVHCNNAKRAKRGEGRRSFIGDPTEVALLEFAMEHGLLHRPLLPRMGELPFDADRKRMTTLHWREGRLVAFVKGAPESVLPLCGRQLIREAAAELDPSERRRIERQSRAFAEQAYRVLAVAMREVEQGVERLTVEAVERDLIFLGLVAMIDPPHREVPEAVARCRRAGVRTIMITGDHPSTAQAIARAIGLIPGDESSGRGRFAPVIDGARVEAMDDEALRRLLTPAHPGEPDPIFARMAPRHKMRIVAALKGMGEVVAVTGDGVNDAPALKQADIGIAMGRAGTDVAKETADMVLLDDNFATIVNAIEEGRAVYANIRKFATYVLVSNVPEVVPYLGYGITGVPLALTIPQVLAVDLGTDMVPAVALGAERPHPGIMDQPPRTRGERLLNRGLLLRVYLFLGLIEAALAMGAFFWFLTSQGWQWGQPLRWSDPLYQQATTVTFAAIVMAQVGNVFACRSERTTVFRLGWLGNPWILGGIAVELVLLAFLVYTPLGNMVLGTRPLPVWTWGVLAAVPFVLLGAEELRKMLANRLCKNDAVLRTPAPEHRARAA